MSAAKNGQRGGGKSGPGGAQGAAGDGRRARAGSAAAGGAAAAPAVATGAPRPLTPGRIGTYVLLFVVGVLVAVAGGLVQAGWFPGGLLLALLGAGGLFYGGALATGTTAGVLVPGAGWLVTVMLLTTSRPEGDFLFGAGLGSYLYLLGGIVVAVICATTAQMRSAGARMARSGK